MEEEFTDLFVVETDEEKTGGVWGCEGGSAKQLV